MNTDIVPGIVPGIAHTLSLEVNDRLLVTAFTPDFSGFADLPPVFGTAFMVGFMEWACVEALRPYLEDGWKSVGTHVYLSHVSPTPLGMKVTANVELLEAKGRTLRFSVACYNECGLIGSGFHERTVIDPRHFMAKVRKKATTLPGRLAA
jgi:fluoroacetyl-CoA thioesterase